MIGLTDEGGAKPSRLRELTREIFAESGTLSSNNPFDVGSTSLFGTQAALAARGSQIEVAAAGVTTASLFSAFPVVTNSTAASQFDWTPAAGAAIATGGLGSFASDPRIAARAGTFIVPTAYRGAAEPGGRKWWANWTYYARN